MCASGVKKEGIDLSPLPRPLPTLLAWLSGSLLNWVVIQLKSAASVLLARGWNGSLFACMNTLLLPLFAFLGKAPACIWDLRPVACLAPALLLSLPNNKAIWMWCWESFFLFFFPSLERIGHLFINTDSQMFPIWYVGGKFTWWNVNKILINLWLTFSTTLRRRFYDHWHHRCTQQFMLYLTTGRTRR